MAFAVRDVSGTVTHSNIEWNLYLFLLLLVVSSSGRWLRSNPERILELPGSVHSCQNPRMKNETGKSLRNSITHGKLIGRTSYLKINSCLKYPLLVVLFFPLFSWLCRIMWGRCTTFLGFSVSIRPNRGKLLDLRDDEHLQMTDWYKSKNVRKNAKEWQHVSSKWMTPLIATYLKQFFYKPGNKK